MERAGRILVSVVAALGLALSGSALAEDAVPIPAAKIDSGLGALPHYSQWREPWLYATPAESIDSGLGALPHYSEWRDPWVYSQPAEKIDSGLGEITASRVDAPAHAAVPGSATGSTY
jgi:hypothetical protein